MRASLASHLVLAQYRYVSVRPTLRTDPSGLISQCPFCSHTNHDWSIDVGGGVEISPPKVDAGIDGCIVIEIPLPVKIGLASISAVVQICMTCFDNKCCPPPSASQCVSFSLGLEAEWSLHSLFGFGNITDDAVVAFEIIGGIFGGLGFMGVSCQAFKERQCKPPGTSFDFQACAQLCAAVASTGVCCSASKGCVVSVRGGWCGAPALEIEITGTRTECR